MALNRACTANQRPRTGVATGGVKKASSLVLDPATPVRQEKEKSLMSQRTEQFTCECGKQFSNRNDLEKHRQNCATAQSAANKTRGAGGNPGGSGSSGSGPSHP